MSQQSQIAVAVKAFVSGLQNMTAKEREQKPSDGYVKTYNKLLGEAKKAAAGVLPSLWPPAVRIAHLFGNRTEADVKYSELISYAAMVVVQLESLPTDPISRRTRSSNGLKSRPRRRATSTVPR